MRAPLCPVGPLGVFLIRRGELSGGLELGVPWGVKGGWEWVEDERHGVGTREQVTGDALHVLFFLLFSCLPTH